MSNHYRCDHKFLDSNRCEKCGVSADTLKRWFPTGAVEGPVQAQHGTAVWYRDHEAVVAELEAERDRYKAALEEIVRDAEQHSSNETDAWGIATEALNG